ncbi:protein CHUP1, chloroplastic isoform X2 [Syzygium oleosum]|uniref:protein CHUP1, chloroplastic isoform X2 n=1 Tax=Syzygium oleosum TaxID=219896 RepID=UPI0011D1B883|nr:protein CHUP1, chloroplastic isoform X2 [Syzygium oleosum]
MVREKRDIRPILLKFGVALALSFAGFLYSRIRTRRGKPKLPPSTDRGGEARSEGQRTGLKNDLHAATAIHVSRITASTTEEKNDETHVPKVYIDPSMVSRSPSSGKSGDKDGYLLPEFNDLVKELDFGNSGAGISPKKDIETPTSDVETPQSFFCTERDVYEGEIKHLRSIVRMLRERERNLEVQLLEYYGLKEQEAAVMEFQNRLKINNMEAKLFTLKIESLQADNRRLEAQVADHAKIAAELDNARSKIKLLKKKLRFEAEQNKEQILALQKRVAALHDQELKAAEYDMSVQSNLQKLEQLEHEVEELKKSNLRLQLDNSDLLQRLESTQLLATSVLEDPEAEALKRQSERLRRENESLTKEIEQLQADRCGDVEELVYLRWINACLRYELRNYQPPAGKTVARDLSKTLSPQSEEKAKQLILEYANTEGITDKAISSIDLDYDQWSSSQASFLTDSGENDDSSVDNSLASKGNTTKKHKLFGKLRRLVLGKDGQDDNRPSSSEKIESLEVGAGSFSSDSPHCSSSVLTGIDAGTTWPSSSITTPCLSSSTHSLDIHRLRSFKLDDAKDVEKHRRNSDVGVSYLSKKSSVSSGGAVDLAGNQEEDSFRKYELAKYAKVLKDSRSTTPKSHRKSASFSSF